LVSTKLPCLADLSEQGSLADELRCWLRWLSSHQAHLQLGHPPDRV